MISHSVDLLGWDLDSVNRDAVDRDLFVFDISSSLMDSIHYYKNVNTKYAR